MTLTDERILELEVIAREASPGPWFEVDGERVLVDMTGYPKDSCGQVAEVYDPRTPEAELRQTKNTTANAVHIAAFNPETALELLAELKRSREQCKKLEEAVKVQTIALEQECWDSEGGEECCDPCLARARVAEILGDK